MSETVLVPGKRDVRATLDQPDGEGATGESDARGCVVACPPHPQLGGSRSDGRLRVVADALADRGIATLRFDYGPWDEGQGERWDAMNAVDWARERYDAVALFGYSFGAAVAMLAAAELGQNIAAVSALAPASKLGEKLDAGGALERVASPVQVVYGERDDTVDWEPVVERARELDATVVSVAGDHHFVGQREAVAEHVAPFLAGALTGRD